MGLTARCRSFWRNTLHRANLEERLSEEMQSHLALRADDLVARHGMAPDAARRRARLEFGSIEHYKEEARSSIGMRLLDEAYADLRFGWRTLLRSRSAAAAVVITLALGIGASIALFSIWYAVLHASLPGVRHPEELVILTNPDQGGKWIGQLDGPRDLLTYEEFEQLRERAGSFSSLMAFESELETWTVRTSDGGAGDATGRLVSGTFFDALGVSAFRGRLLSAADDRADVPEAVISYRFWQRRFGGRADVVGQTIVLRKASTLRTATLTVAGVAPPGFIGATAGQYPDVWVPMRMQKAVVPGLDRLHDAPPDKVMWLQVLGRLKPGVPLPRAAAEVNSLFQAELQPFYGAAASGDRLRQLLNQHIVVRPAAAGTSASRPELSASLTLLLFAVLILLLVACANLANLMLARGSARRAELALRMSLGANSARVIRQLATESVALVAIGGVMAIPVGLVLHQALVQLIARAREDFTLGFSLNAPVAACLVATLAVAVVACGLWPAWQVTNGDMSAVLKEEDRGATRASRRWRTDRVLVSMQLALALPLLVGAGLLTRTLLNLQGADLGFATDRLQLVRVNLHDQIDADRQESLLQQLRERLSALPGVTAVSFSQLGIFTGGVALTDVEVEGHRPARNEDRESSVDTVGPAYFSTTGTRIIAGREILDRDRGPVANVAVVNGAFVRKFLGTRDPVGRQFTPVGDGERTTYTIIGVARDAHTQQVRGAVAPRFFVPLHVPASMAESPTLLIRSTASGPTLLTLRTTIQQLAPTVPILFARSFDQQLSPLTAQDRTVAQIAVTFGAIALLLAAVGLYGVLAYSVVRRAGEIAVRMALGADSRRVVTMILAESARVVVAGLSAGVFLAYGSSRLIASQLYGVNPSDPATIATGIAALLTVAGLAAYLPARRAAALDPMATLRQQ